MGYALSTQDGQIRIQSEGDDGPEEQLLTVDEALELARLSVQGRAEPWAQLVHGLLWQVREARWQKGESRPTQRFGNPG